MGKRGLKEGKKKRWDKISKASINFTCGFTLLYYEVSRTILKLISRRILTSKKII